jgi:FkbM family methyltransferase
MGLIELIMAKLRRSPDRFLQRISGVIHVGANTGQERELYERLNLNVVWIEAIPEVFRILKENLAGLPNQFAYQYLVADRDNNEHHLHIANNNGASSSILPLHQHKDIWPHVDYIDKITLQSITLPTFLRREKINPAAYQALVMDTQGSELLILQGSVPVLHNFKYIKLEVPDFESYLGCCQLADINDFMAEHGFKEFSRNKLISRSAGGAYYDVVFRINKNIY